VPNPSNPDCECIPLLAVSAAPSRTSGRARAAVRQGIAQDDTKQHATRHWAPSTKNLARRSAIRPLTCADTRCVRSPGRRSFYPSPTRSLAWFDNKAQVGDDSAWSPVQSNVVQWRCVLPRIRHLAGWKLARHDLAELIRGSSLASITLQPTYTRRGIPRVARGIDLSPAADGPTTPRRGPQRRRQNPRIRASARRASPRGPRGGFTRWEPS
jgi:hypothetical protein